ncbi:hypothetical protein Tco_0421698 [Tanacetum coccineum]
MTGVSRNTNREFTGCDTVVPKSVAGSRFPEGVLMKNKDAASSIDIQLICAEFSSIQSRPQQIVCCCKVHNSITQGSRTYVVPTGRVIVPTGRYAVPDGN